MSNLTRVVKNRLLQGKAVRFWLNIPQELCALATDLKSTAEKNILKAMKEGFLQGELHIPFEDQLVSGYWLLSREKDAVMTEFVEHAIRMALRAVEEAAGADKAASNVNIASLVQELLADWNEGTY